MDRDDPSWTALALGEAAPGAVIDALGRDPDARDEVARTRTMAQLMRAMYREARRPRRSVRPWVLAAAAALRALAALWTLRPLHGPQGPAPAVARRGSPTPIHLSSPVVREVVPPTTPGDPGSSRESQRGAIQMSVELE